jgi:hypothetical protein
MKRRLVPPVAVLYAVALLMSTTAVAQQVVPGTLAVRVLTEKRVAALPVGRPTFHWRVETFSSLAQAQAAAGPWALAAEAFGRAWLFTLGPKGGSSSGGTKIVDVGPLPPVVATDYLLRINEGTGAPGSITTVHSHPGIEAFYVLSGEMCLRTLKGVLRIPATRAEAGAEPDVPIQVSSCGSTELRQLIMFVVDANRAFSSPATLP